MKNPVVEKVIKWVTINRLEAMFLAIILFVAVFLRLYKISEYMTFLGDEGRDAIVVRRLLTDFDIILVGPGTSIGNMYLGPLYYYLIAPFLFLANFSPVGPSVMVALLGIVTTYFVWHVSREWFGKLAAFIAAILYSVSPVVITYSRSSWNPNIMPFFALLSVYSIWKVWRFDQMKWLLILGFSFAFALQSHYLALLLVPIFGLFWLLTIFRLKDNKIQREKIIKYSLLSLTLFSILMSPLVIFDARHGWRNVEAIKIFFTERQATVSARPWTALPKIFSIWSKIETRMLTGFNENLGKFFASLSALFVLTYLIPNFKKIKTAFLDPEKDQFLSSYIFLFVWLFISLIGFGLYKQEIYDHYYGIIFPAIFILVGAMVQLFFNRNKFVGSLLTLVFVPTLVVVNLNNSFLKYPPNKQLQRTESVARKMVEEAKGREFNLAVIAERNYEGAYQYFLEKWNAPFVMIDPQRADKTITDQLFVVCELPKEKCDPTHDPKAGIANFGWSKVDSEWEVSGVVLYKLVHYVDL